MTPMTDAERELHIKSCGWLIESAMARGDKEAARTWSQAQTEAIAGRSAAQVARMEACYFDTQGETDRAAMGVNHG